MEKGNSQGAVEKISEILRNVNIIQPRINEFSGTNMRIDTKNRKIKSLRKQNSSCSSLGIDLLSLSNI
ncbi:hypothetical protein QQP08_004559 [Theobroma cacao]|nr:hypothetical protein QQP08_004559 [Theobroma cacao]